MMLLASVLACIVLGALAVVSVTSTVLLARDRNALLNEKVRLPLQRGQPLADRILLPAFMASFAALVGAQYRRYGALCGR